MLCLRISDPEERYIKLDYYIIILRNANLCPLLKLTGHIEIGCSGGSSNPEESYIKTIIKELHISSYEPCTRLRTN